MYSNEIDKGKGWRKRVTQVLSKLRPNNPNHLISRSLYVAVRHLKRTLWIHEMMDAASFSQRG